MMFACGVPTENRIFERRIANPTRLDGPKDAAGLTPIETFLACQASFNSGICFGSTTCPRNARWIKEETRQTMDGTQVYEMHGEILTHELEKKNPQATKRALRLAERQARMVARMRAQCDAVT